MTTATLRGIAIEPLAPGSPEWLRHMSASKVAAVLGLSPYDSRFSLWHRMAGSLDLEPENDEMRRGLFLEPGIKAWFYASHPELMALDGGCWRHPEHERLTASPDGRSLNLGEDELTGLEVKTAADADEWGEPGTDQIPAGYRAQVVFQMDVIGYRRTHVAVLMPFLDLREYVVDYDPDEAAFIRMEALAFLDSLPDGTNPSRPDIDAHTATYEAVRRLHPDITPADVDVPLDLARRYCQAIAGVKAAKDEETQAKALLLDVLGDSRRALYVGQPIATRQPNGKHAPKLVPARSLPIFEQESA